MNIMFFNVGPVAESFGGIQRVTKLLADFFSKKGHKVFFLSSYTIEESKKFYRADSRGLCFHENQYFLPDSLKNGIPESDISFFKNFLDENNIDILINQGGLSEAVSGFAYNCKRLRPSIRLFSVIHSTILNKFDNIAYIKENRLRKMRMGFLLPVLKNPLFIFMLRKFFALKLRRHYKTLCRESDKVVLLSDYLKPEFGEVVGFQPKNVVAINNPACEDFDFSDLSQKKKKILWVGRADDGKRLDIFVKIWERVFEKFPDWQADVLGDGYMLAACKKYAADKGVEGINFRGFAESRDYFREASIFCFTTTYEGFGMALLEAMQSSCAPVCFNSFATAKELVSDGDTGFLVKPFDVGEYAEKLSALMDSGELRNSMARGSYKKSKDFSMDVVGARWLAAMSEK